MEARFVLLCVVAAAVADDCCWCGKRYYVGTPTFNNTAQYTGVAGVQVSAATELGFYVAELGESPALFVFVAPHEVGGRASAVGVEVDVGFPNGTRQSERLAVPTASHPSGDVYVVPLRLELKPDTHTQLECRVRTADDRAAHTSAVTVHVAPSLAFVRRVGATRVALSPHLTHSLQRFGEGEGEGQAMFPYGFFVSWPLVAANATHQLDNTVGNTLHPVPPFTPGGTPAVDAATRASDVAGVRWFYDMRHDATNLTAIRQQVLRYRENSAIASWYIADEPDGAGNAEGFPEGISVGAVQAAYALVKQLDPYHIVSLSLNCKYSSALYSEHTDVVMVDPYPIGINTTLCSVEYGCCGCDNCAGSVLDVPDRVDFVRQQTAASKVLHVVGQGFGGTGEHWSRQPTSAEFVVMTYLAVVHGASGGVTYWLQSDNTSPLLADARGLSAELALVSSVAFTRASQPLAVTCTAPTHSAAWCNANHTLIALAFPSPSPSVVECVLPSLAAVSPARARVVFGSGAGRVVDVVDGNVRDAPEPGLGRRVMVLDLPCAH